MVTFWVLLTHEVKLAAKSGGGALTGIIFFLSVVTIMPFAVGPDLQLLARLGPAILWIGALLATLLGLDRLLKSDEEDGALDILRMADDPLEMIVFIKAIAHWLVTGLPLVIAAPLFGLLLNMDGTAIAATALTLLVGTPALTFFGAIGAGLTVGLRRGGLLLPILILPITIPAVIFGVAASYAASDAQASFQAPFAFLCALSLFSALLSPFATAWAVRLSSR